MLQDCRSNGQITSINFNVCSMMIVVCQQVCHSCCGRFVALDGSDAEPGSSTAQAAAGDETGIVQLRLSNGVRVNLRHTDNEPQSAMLRMIATGGKAREGVHLRSLTLMVPRCQWEGIRLLVGPARCSDSCSWCMNAGEGAGPTGNGVVAVGTRTLSESGTVGTWEREQARCCHAK